MSLYIDLSINDLQISGIAITRTTSHGSDPDSVNFYRWHYATKDETRTGLVEHRYGDGAVVLARLVLQDITVMQQIAGEAQAQSPTCGGTDPSLRGTGEQPHD